MTDVQFYLALVVALGWGFGLGLGISRVFDRLGVISEQIKILPEISDKLTAIHEAINKTARNPGPR